jgi:hypothetical protein
LRQILVVIGNLFHAFRVLRRDRPDLVLAVATAQAIPFGIVARLLGMEMWYAESITRMKAPCRTTTLMHALRIPTRLYYYSRDLRARLPRGICMEVQRP